MHVQSNKMLSLNEATKNTHDAIRVEARTSHSPRRPTALRWWLLRMGHGQGRGPSEGDQGYHYYYQN